MILRIMMEKVVEIFLLYHYTLGFAGGTGSIDTVGQISPVYPYLRIFLPGRCHDMFKEQGAFPDLYDKIHPVVCDPVRGDKITASGIMIDI